jgi:WD40 repeat protein
MMLITAIGNRAMPRPDQPTSVPVIATPSMGVAGTAAAQTVPTAIPGKRLLAFAVDEQKGLLAVSYENDSLQSVLQVRPWSASESQNTWITLERGMTDYTNLSFDPQSNSLLASSSAEALVRTFDLKTQQGKSVSPVFQTAYSPNGEWLATLSSEREVILKLLASDSDTSTRAIQTQGVPISITFSPDNQMIALVEMDNAHYHRHHIEVFSLPYLTSVKSYTFEGVISSPLVFSPDNIHIAFGIDNSVRVLSLTSDEQRYFDTVKPIQHLTIDPTGKWLAVVGGETDPGGDKLVTFYDLEESNALAPTLVMTQGTRMNDDIVGIQFVKEGILVGEAWGVITLYRWDGKVWSNPVIVMDNFK